MTICIAENSGGKGGIAGGAGAQGQASQNATGAAAHGYGYPVIEVVTGMKWEQYLKKEVLDPLGMASTSFDNSIAQKALKVYILY